MTIYKALTIAGSDSGGGAGIQADLKTFQELNVYGMSVITALTAQNTLGVQAVFPQSVEAVESQIDAVMSDIGTDAAKTGMLFSKAIIEAVAKKVRKYQINHFVVDPVMIAKSGATLLQEEAIEAMCEHLLPLALLITPNLPEAARLTGAERIESIDDMKEAAKRLSEFGPKNVLIKGGHLGKDKKAIDILYDGRQFFSFESERIDTKHTHGTGCTYSAAIAAELAKGCAVDTAVGHAKQYMTFAIKYGLEIGKGIGPTNHSAHRTVAISKQEA